MLHALCFWHNGLRTNDNVHLGPGYWITEPALTATKSPVRLVLWRKILVKKVFLS
jgi:hypothetical protein